MTNKFQNKYRISSARLQNWDYRWNAAYFVTICTQNRIHYFGEIVKTGQALSLQRHALSQIHSHMQLSNIGILANVFWYEIKNHANNVELGEFVVMPNHIHGILILNNNDEPTTKETDDKMDGNRIDGTVDNDGIVRNDDINVNVETRHALSLQSNQSNQQSSIGHQRFQNQGKNSLSAIIGSYKSAVTRHANRLEFPFAWQPRFHDHIIRNGIEYDKIRNYIANNPKNWKDDKFYA